MKYRSVNALVVLLLARTIEGFHANSTLSQSENEHKPRAKRTIPNKLWEKPTVFFNLCCPFDVSPIYPDSPNNIPPNQDCGDTFRGSCQPNSPYRTIDGSCNNLRNPTWGMAGTRYARISPAKYSDRKHAPARSKTNQELPPARSVSYMLFPAADKPDPRWTLAAMQYGQIIAHDMGSRTEDRPGVKECCTGTGRLVNQSLNSDGCMPLMVGPNDPDYQGVECLAFTRSDTDRDRGCSTDARGHDEQLSSVTHYLDLSIVYGSTDELARSLRSGDRGRLKVDVRQNQEWPPRAPNYTTYCSADMDPTGVCYAAGDDRVNSNTQLTVLHIILMREHNRVAGELARMNPHWTDEKIYQEARRIVIAMNQYIAYYEWLPIFIGEKEAYVAGLVFRKDNYVNDYNPSVDPSALNEHSNGAFRVFHSAITGFLKVINEQRQEEESLRISDYYNRPEIIERKNHMDDLTRGLATQPQQMQDEFYEKEITRHLFEGPNRLGGDLRALDIQRGRDHGLATYNDFRQFCEHPPARAWQDLADVMDQKNIDKLARLYESPEDVDLSVGGALENLIPGTLTGPTFQCILSNQFVRTRRGDRFWFESPNTDVAFTNDQLREIKKASMARWFCDNADGVKSMQPRAFELPSGNNSVQDCQDLPRVDLSFWKDSA